MDQRRHIGLPECRMSAQPVYDRGPRREVDQRWLFSACAPLHHSAFKGCEGVNNPRSPLNLVEYTTGSAVRRMIAHGSAGEPATLPEYIPVMTLIAATFHVHQKGYELDRRDVHVSGSQRRCSGRCGRRNSVADAPCSIGIDGPISKMHGTHAVECA